MRTARFSTCLHLSILIATLAVRAPAQEPLTGRGTAVVDGIFSPGEWDAAAQVEPPARNANGAPVGAVLYLMHDAQNLYIALRVAASDTQSSSWALYFDEDSDQKTEPGEDMIVLGGAGFFDQVLSQQVAGALVPVDDVKVNGRVDGSGVREIAGGETIFEISHPLSSGDTADFSLAEGSVAGMRSIYKACSGCAASAYPSASLYTPFKIGSIAPPPLSGCGTAKIDGILSASEWQLAAEVAFDSIDPDGNTHPSRMLVMNDFNNLYFGVEIQSSVEYRAGVSVEFDNDNDGATIVDREEGDDEFVLNNKPTPLFTDATRSNLPPCTESPPLFCSFLDDDRGGAQHGRGTTSFNGAAMVFEISHPLKSGDSRDISLEPGDTVGYYFSLTMCSPTNCERAHLPNSSYFGRIRICKPEVSFEYALKKASLPNPSGWVDVDCLLHTYGLSPGEDGAQGWSLSLAEVGGCQIAAATHLGTAAEQADFQRIELTSGPNNKGVVAAAVLSFDMPVTLDPGDSPHRILHLDLAPGSAGCADCALVFRDGLQGSGQPFTNSVTHNGTDFVPATSVIPLAFKACGTFAPWPLPPPGWKAHSLGLMTQSANRNPLKGVFELASDAKGYGSSSDSLRAVYWGGKSDGIAAFLREVSPGGMAGLELRRGDELDASSPCVRLTVMSDAVSGRLSLKAGKRLSDAAAMTDIRLTSPPQSPPLALPLKLHLAALEPDQVSIVVSTKAGELLATATVPFVTGGFTVRPGMVQASPGGIGSARFCAVYPPLTGYDTDGDGCTDCEDEHPDRAFVVVGERKGPCCTGSHLVYHFEGEDTDGDGARDCEDPDDDNDGIPDADDPCQLGGSCDQKDACPCAPNDWVVCKPFECGPYFLKLFDKGDPANALVFERIEIVNLAFYLQPLAGMSAAESAHAILSLGKGVGGGSGGGQQSQSAQRVLLELWERDIFPGKDRRLVQVGDFDLAEFDFEAFEGEKLLYLEPPHGKQQGQLGGVWVVGESLGFVQPDDDHDGAPNAFDNCPSDANADQKDTDGNGVGDECEIQISAVGRQVPGDGNQDGKLDISDAVHLLGILFLGVGEAPCGDKTLGHGDNIRLLDSNGDGRVDLSDSVAVISFLFLGGPPPVRGTECIQIDQCPFRCL